MAAPIQIVLNHENFEEAREVSQGGSKKDFFAHRDADFAAHKRGLIERAESIANILEGQPEGGIGFVKVVLRKSAWAKSHRPLNSLFRADRVPLVGGGDLGELYFEVDPPRLRTLGREIRKAEEETRLKLNLRTGKEQPNPSTIKSEVGAIERVELYGVTDRRDFSVEDAVAWLSNPLTGSSYHIELFEAPPARSEWDALHPSRQRLYLSFVEGLARVGQGLNVQRLPTALREHPQLSLRLGRSDEPPAIMLTTVLSSDRRPKRDLVPFDNRVDRHMDLLSFLDSHPLVRRIELPPVVTRTIEDEKISGRSSATAGRTVPEAARIPGRIDGESYPILGIVDGGVSNAIDPWVIDKWDVLSDEDTDLEHGTFIGGLALAANSMNGSSVCQDPDGMDLVDVAVFPDENQANAFESYYPAGVPDFFDEIEAAVAGTQAQYGVRVFNMSLNIQHQAAPNRYSSFASRLDGIAEAQDALFVVSAGNTDPQNTRPEWSADNTQALVDLVSAREDGILMPAESVRNLAVAALNPPGSSSIVPYAPANYSRRGPGVRAGVKPDLAHVGGTGSPQPHFGHGLYSIRPDGSVCDSCGTSYAAPLVAKTAALLDHSIEGDVSRETLMALLLHHAQMPEVLQSKLLRPVGRDLVGFGVPPGAQQILEGDDHQITLVFASRLRRDQQIEFNFAWPSSMVLPGGKCRGHAKLTLVSTPPLDTRYGAEFVRVNISAKLQQEEPKEDGSAWKGRLNPIYLPGDTEGRRIEAERIEHDLKWSPVKSFEKSMPRGVGKSSNWRLFVEYLTRSREELPENGVPFTAILTIRDPRMEVGVFDEMRQNLQSIGAVIEDIRTAARITPRV